MSKARKKREARKARRKVNRGERIRPTPETAAKLRPHPLELLLALGRDDGGIDADQWQCAEQIIDAYAAVAPSSGIASADLERIGHRAYGDSTSAHAEHLTEIWFAWADELLRRWRLTGPVLIVELLTDRRPHGPLAATLISRALDLWAKVRRDLAPDTQEVSTIRVNSD